MRLQVGIDGARQLVSMFWESQKYGTVYHGTVNGYGNIVKCVPTFHSMYVANVAQAEVCLDYEISAATTGGFCLFGGPSEYGYYTNLCTNPTTINNVGPTPQCGIEKWDIELGETSAVINYQDFTARENILGEILLNLT